MSRSALNRQLALAVSSGGESALDPFSLVDSLLAMVPEEVAEAALPIHNNGRTCNLDVIVATNIVESNYFRRDVVPLNSCSALVAAIAAAVTHVDAYNSGSTATGATSERQPSPAWCIMYRMGLARLTADEYRSLVDHRSNDYVRAVALLCLRHILAPAELADWVLPHWDDPTLFRHAASGKTPPMPFGLWVRSLCESRYGSVMFPRLPYKIETEFSVLKEVYKQDDARAARNARFKHTLVPGARVRARWSDDSKWYPAVIEAAASDRDAIHASGNKWWIAYDGFDGDAELRSLGQIEIEAAEGSSGKERGGSPVRAGNNYRDREMERGDRDTRDGRDPYSSSRRRSTSRDRYERRRGSSRSRSPERRDRERHNRRPSPTRSPPRDERSRYGGGADDVDAIRRQITERERERVVASGKDYAAPRVRGFKESMSMSHAGPARSNRAPSPPRRTDRDGGREYGAPATSGYNRPSTAAPTTNAAAAPARPKEAPTAAALARFQNLMRQYGASDAGAVRKTASDTYGSKSVQNRDAEDVMRVRGW